MPRRRAASARLPWVRASASAISRRSRRSTVAGSSPPSQSAGSRASPQPSDAGIDAVAKVLAEKAGEEARITILGPAAPSWKHGPRSVRDGRGPRDTYG